MKKTKICADDDINVIEPNAIQYTHVVFFVVIARDQGGGQNFNFTNEMFSSYSFAVPYCLLLIVNKKRNHKKNVNSIHLSGSMWNNRKYSLYVRTSVKKKCFC